MFMPLTLAKTGEEVIVQRVGGKEDTRLYLESMGFVPGTKVTVVSEIQGNLIIMVRETRIALGKDLANKIMVK